MFTERQQKILDFFLQSPDAPRGVGDLPDFAVDRSTVFRDIQALSKSGILVPEMETRGRTYSLNRDSDAYLEWDLSRPPYQRQDVKYRTELLDEYIPNKSFLLTDAHRHALLATEKAAGGDAAQSGKAYRRVISSLIIDLTHASSNLENVPISWLDTKSLIEFGESPAGLSETQLKIVLNHKSAISFLVENGAGMSYSQRDLMDIHSLLIRGLLADKLAIGALRTRTVKFDDSRYLPPDNPHQLREAFAQFCEKAGLIKDPYEQAFFAMLFIPYIQPFQDGNKRVSRIAMNIALVKKRLAPFSFSDIKKRDYMFGLLAFYERGEHRFLANAFVGAYQKTVPRYADLIGYVNQGGILSTLSEGVAGSENEQPLPAPK